MYVATGKNEPALAERLYGRVCRCELTVDAVIALGSLPALKCLEEGLIVGILG